MIRGFIAQVENWMSPLANFGAVGIVLLWFMFRSESRMNDIKDAMENLAKSQLLSVVANQEASVVVREQAEKMLKDMEERHRRRSR